MSTIYHMDVATLFVDDEENGHHLDLKNVTPPELEEMEEDHMGGGSAMQMGLPMAIINKIVVPFQLKGVGLDMQKHFMGRKLFTIRGNVFNVRTEEDTPIRMVVNGKIRKASISQFEKSSGVDSDFEIGNINRYQMFAGNGNSPLYQFDALGHIGDVIINGERPYGTKARNAGLL